MTTKARKARTPKLTQVEALNQWADRAPASVLEFVELYLNVIDTVRQDDPELSETAVTEQAQDIVRKDFPRTLSDSDREWVRNELHNWLHGIPKGGQSR